MAPMLASAQQTSQSAIHCRVSFDAAARAALTAVQKEEIREWQRDVEAGPFYRELVSKLGRPEACTMKVDVNSARTFKEEGWEARLSYFLHGEERLVVELDNPFEELVEEMRLPSVTAKRALELLKAAEKHSYDEDGCGIDWTKPTREKGRIGPILHTRARSAPGTSEVLYLSDTCNCRAGVVYTGDQITGLRLSSVC